MSGRPEGVEGVQGTDHLHARGTSGVQAVTDPIVDEVRRVRDAHAARFHYDLGAIFQDIKEQERESGLRFVGGVAHPVRPTPPTIRPTAPVSDGSQLPQVGPAGER
jgi:hypothetical protein